MNLRTVSLVLLFLAASAHVELVDEVYTIPHSEWRYVQVQLHQVPVAVRCEFRVLTAGAPVRVALLSRADLERLRAAQSHGFLAATSPQTAGRFVSQLQHPGEYAVVVDNRGQPSAVRVHLRVALDFSGRAAQRVGTLSPQRRLAVILISFAVFFGIVTWSARKLLRAIKK